VFRFGSVFLVLVLAVRAAAQTTSISGTTLDDRTGEPLPGVLVYIENQPVFAETDADGRFTLPVPPGIYTIARHLHHRRIADRIRHRASQCHRARR